MKKGLLLPLLCLSSIALVGCNNTCNADSSQGKNDTGWQVVELSNDFELVIYIGANHYTYTNRYGGYEKIEYRFVSYTNYSEITVNWVSQTDKDTVNTDYYAGTNVSYRISSYI